MAKLAPCLDKLRSEVNSIAPGRGKAADGWIGDAAHSARKSDHNPDSRGIVHAVDLTHDPRNSADMNVLSEFLKKNKDKRISYIIWNRRIWTPAKSADWRAYDGSNPHDKHMHVSCKAGATFENDQSSWGLTSEQAKPVLSAPASEPFKKLMRGSTDAEEIKELWRLLQAQEENFGPILEAAVRAYQKTKGLDADGIVGAYTWGSLKTKTGE